MRILKILSKRFNHVTEGTEHVQNGQSQNEMEVTCLWPTTEKFTAYLFSCITLRHIKANSK